MLSVNSSREEIPYASIISSKLSLTGIKPLILYIPILASIDGPCGIVMKMKTDHEFRIGPSFEPSSHPRSVEKVNKICIVIKINT